MCNEYHTAGMQIELVQVDLVQVDLGHLRFSL